MHSPATDPSGRARPARAISNPSRSSLAAAITVCGMVTSVIPRRVMGASALSRESCRDDGKERRHQRRCHLPVTFLTHKHIVLNLKYMGSLPRRICTPQNSLPWISIRLPLHFVCLSFPLNVYYAGMKNSTTNSTGLSHYRKRASPRRRSRGTTCR